MKQMQIYVSMPSFNISESKDWHRTNTQQDASCVYMCAFERQRVHAFLHTCLCGCLARGWVCVSV